jgi:hypothetical protein
MHACVEIKLKLLCKKTDRQSSEASTVGGEKEWYFFCLRGRKYRNSIRPNRVTGSGFWKATGIDRPIYSVAAGAAAANSGESIGLKKSLVYYRGSAGKGTKTDWMMHEFRLPPAATDASPSMQEAVSEVHSTAPRSCVLHFHQFNSRSISNMNACDGNSTKRLVLISTRHACVNCEIISHGEKTLHCQL